MLYNIFSTGMFPVMDSVFNNDIIVTMVTRELFSEKLDSNFDILLCQQKMHW